MSQHDQDNNVLSRITSLLNEINSVKKERVKQARSVNNDPGGYSGASSHPSASVHGFTYDVETGSRYSENDAYMKSTYGDVGVDNSPMNNKTQSDRQMNVGLRQSAVGEDPEIERNYKAWKDDTETEHPANADDVGNKYGAAYNLAAEALDFMNEILADLVAGNTQQAAPQNTKTASSDLDLNNASEEELLNYIKSAIFTGPEDDADEDSADIEKVGGSDADDEDLSENLEQEIQNEKIALARDLAFQSILDAEKDADLVGEWLTKYAWQRNELLKKAVDSPGDFTSEIMNSIPLDDIAAGADSEQGQGVSSEDTTAEQGEETSNDQETQVDGGEITDAEYQDAINELANALVELGVDPDELVQSIQESVENPDADSVASAADPGSKEVTAGARRFRTKRASVLYQMPLRARLQLYKAAAAVQHHIRSGKLKLKYAAPGTQRRRERDEIIAYLKEVCGR